ncbi:hypothetical protein GCM10028804_27890 [Larkinella terrae]
MFFFLVFVATWPVKTRFTLISPGPIRREPVCIPARATALKSAAVPLTSPVFIPIKTRTIIPVRIPPVGAVAIAAFVAKPVFPALGLVRIGPRFAITGPVAVGTLSTKTVVPRFRLAGTTKPGPFFARFRVTKPAFPVFVPIRAVVVPAEAPVFIRIKTRALVPVAVEVPARATTFEPTAAVFIAIRPVIIPVETRAIRTIVVIPAETPVFVPIETWTLFPIAVKITAFTVTAFIAGRVVPARSAFEPAPARIFVAERIVALPIRPIKGTTVVIPFKTRAIAGKPVGAVVVRPPTTVVRAVSARFIVAPFPAFEVRIAVFPIGIFVEFAVKLRV